MVDDYFWGLLTGMVTDTGTFGLQPRSDISSPNAPSAVKSSLMPEERERKHRAALLFK